MEVVGKDPGSGQTGLLEAAYTRGPDYVGLALTGGLSINSRSVVNRQYSPEMGLQRAQWTRSHQVR